MALAALAGVRPIIDARAPWCVTIYGEAAAWLHGNHLPEPARAQVRTAVRMLLDGGAPAPVVAQIRGQLDQLAKPRADHEARSHRVHGVGIFATPEHADLIPLTTAPAPWVGVGDRFVIGPLVEGMLAAQPRAFVLAASENRVRLIDATATHAEEIGVPDLPGDLRSAARLDVGGDRDTLAHLRISEDPDERLRAYAREIHRAVENVRRPAHAVLVLAAAEPLLSILAATAPEPKLVIGRITGNHDDAGPEHLADLADPHLRAHRDRWRGAERPLGRIAARPSSSRPRRDREGRRRGQDRHALHRHRLARAGRERRARGRRSQPARSRRRAHPQRPGARRHHHSRACPHHRRQWDGSSSAPLRGSLLIFGERAR